MRNELTLILMLLGLACGAQLSKDEKDTRALLSKLKVRSATTYKAEYTNLYGKPTLGQQRKVVTTKYDNAGRVADEIEYNARGTVESWISFKYDGKGNAEEVTHRNADGTPKLTKYCVNKYDSLGRLDMVLVYESDSTLLWRTDCFYDEKDNLVEVDEYKVLNWTASDGKRTDQANFDSYRTYTYDGKGRAVKTEFYDNAKNYVRRIECKYGQDGRLSEQVDYYVSTYKYGANGLQTEATSYGGANGDQPVAVYKIVYEYRK